MQRHQPDATPWDGPPPSAEAVAAHLLKEGRAAWVTHDGDGTYVGLRAVDQPHDRDAYYTAAPGPRGTAGEWVWSRVIGGVGANQGGYVCRPGSSTPLLGAHAEAAELARAFRALVDSPVDGSCSAALSDPVNTRWFEAGTNPPGSEPGWDQHAVYWPEADP